MKVAAVIQARMSSKRLPGKVLKEIKGKPLLLYLVESMQRCSSLDDIVVATSNEKSDRPVVDFCKAQGITYFTGSLRNVAKRFRDLLSILNVDAFVRINGDSPVMDHRLVSQAVNILCESSYDIVTNVLTRTFPKGQSVEAIRRDIYCSHYPFFVDEYDREHVTPYFYRNAPQFNIFNVKLEKDWGNVQLSIDTPEDFCAIEKMIYHMNDPHWKYDLETLMDLRKRALSAKNGKD